MRQLGHTPSGGGCGSRGRSIIRPAHGWFAQSGAACPTPPGLGSSPNSGRVRNTGTKILGTRGHGPRLRHLLSRLHSPPRRRTGNRLRGARIGGRHHNLSRHCVLIMEPITTAGQRQLLNFFARLPLLPCAFWSGFQRLTAALAQREQPADPGPTETRDELAPLGGEPRRSPSVVESTVET